MRRWLYAFRGAFLTWAVLPFSVVTFGGVAIIWANAAYFYPLAPVVFQGPYVAALAIATVLVLVFLAFLHGTPNRRGRVMRNLAEIAGLAATFVVAIGLIEAFIDGPKTQTLVLFGETFHAPTEFQPFVSKAKIGKVSFLGLTVCGPNDTPVSASDDCRKTEWVRYGNEVFLEEFHPRASLEEAGARHRGDTLVDLGQHQAGTEPGEIIYSKRSTEILLWLDPAQRVEVLRLCKLDSGPHCTAMARIDDRSIIFPLHDMDGTASKTALLTAAQLWVEKIESWRCAQPKTARI